MEISIRIEVIQSWTKHCPDLMQFRVSLHNLPMRPLVGITFYVLPNRNTLEN